MSLNVVVRGANEVETRLERRKCTSLSNFIQLDSSVLDRVLFTEFWIAHHFSIPSTQPLSAVITPAKLL
jgi:hypothetical protein